MSSESQGRFGMPDGFELFYRRWGTGGEPEKVILGLNGIGSHSGAYRLMGENLPKLVPALRLYATDRRGFGNSVEPGLTRGAVSDFNKYLSDLDYTVRAIRKENQGKRVFLFGKSEGTIHALRFASMYPDSVDGLILAASPVIPKANTSGAGLIARVVVLRIFSPNSMIDTFKLQPEAVRNSNEVQAAMEDPMSSHMKFSARFAMGVPSLIRSILRYASGVTVATLILQGDSDNTVVPDGAKRLFDALGSKDKSLKTFAGADHNFYDSLPPRLNPTYDQDARKPVYDAVADWLKAH